MRFTRGDSDGFRVQNDLISKTLASDLAERVVSIKTIAMMELNLRLVSRRLTPLTRAGGGINQLFEVEEVIG